MGGAKMTIIFDRDEDDYSETIGWLQHDLGLPEVLAEGIGFELTISMVKELSELEIIERLGPSVNAFIETAEEQDYPVEELGMDHAELCAVSGVTAYRLIHVEDEHWITSSIINWCWTASCHVFDESEDNDIAFARAFYEYHEERAAIDKKYD